jgi:hypothetical protein
MSNPFIKPIAMAGVIVAGNTYLLGETDMMRSAYFGLLRMFYYTGALGTYGAQLVAPLVPLEKMLPSGSYTDSKTLELRVLEIAGTVASGIALNKYVLKNDNYVNIQPEKIYLLVAADFVAEYISDYMENRPLSFFQ